MVKSIPTQYRVIEIFGIGICNNDNVLHNKNRNYRWNFIDVASYTTIVLSIITLLTIFSSSQIMFSSPIQGVYGLGAQFTLGSFNHTGLELNTKAFLDKLQQKGGPPIYTLSPDKARAVLSEIQASHPVPKLPANIENRTIPGGPNGKEISITIIRPPQSGNETLPVVMYFHGGGWVLGGLDTHD
ncbi:MAG: alpha/beta hydrolase, partial [Thermoproteota archaeon]|nr:alpha/beta hydrolase [Thermoproteota archaeon]